jgi:hypothetical protein
MNATKKTGRIVGALFLAVVVTFFIGHELVGSVLDAPDYLAHVYPNKTRVLTGAYLELIEIVAVVGIIILMSAILSKHHKRMAIGYVVFRTLECVMLIVAVLSPLLLVTLSQEYLQAGVPDASHFQTLGALFLAARAQWSTLILGDGSPPGALLQSYWRF